MTRVLIVLVAVVLMASCRTTKNIQTAIAKKDSSVVVMVPSEDRKNDTVEFIHNILRKVDSSRLNFQTFTAKVNVDYQGSEGKNYNVNANVRMYKDSAIWISANAVLGIEALRMLITKDSVKLLNKLEKTYTARTVDYLQEMTQLPLDLKVLQDLIIGNPVFIDTNVVSFATNGSSISLLSLGQWFKNLLTVDANGNFVLHSKLDDADLARNRTADLLYSDYETKKGVPFAAKRRITVSEKKRLDVKLDFKQYDFNTEVSFPFSIPKNYSQS